MRAPKVGKTLPKPLTVEMARRVADAGVRGGEDRPPWVLARDAAVLALLYGSGLRISEALALRRREVPLPGGLSLSIVLGGRRDQNRVRQLFDMALRDARVAASDSPPAPR